MARTAARFQKTHRLVFEKSSRFDRRNRLYARRRAEKTVGFCQSLTQERLQNAFCSYMLSEERIFIRLRHPRAFAFSQNESVYFTVWATTEHASITNRPNRSSGMFGGNSNWRGPVWFPVNYLLIESLQKFDFYYGDDFKIEFPTGSGKNADAVGSFAGALKASVAYFFKRRDGNARRLRQNRKISNGRTLARLHSFLRIFSRR